MSSIGPQLPPHLTKRKRTPGDDYDDDESEAAGGPLQPPSKTSRLANDDEIDLDDDSSDDDFGPSTAAAGPTLPTSSAPTDKNGTKPPGPRATGPSMPQQNTESDVDHQSRREEPARRVLGPAAPPADLSERPPNPPSSDEDSDDDDDDDYGPALPTSAQAAQRSAAAAEASARLAQDAESAAVAAAAAPSKRDDWMIRPPPPTNKPDPTKIRAKGFATGRAATSTAGQNPGEIGSMWTETVQERKDRILSRRGPDASSSSAAATSNKNPGDDARDAAIRAYTSQTRGKSLYEEHQANRKAGGGARTAGEEDDPSKRAFDREKDMAVGGRVTNAQMRDLRKQAADFGGRFSKGKYL
ncbi:hypothetical protein PpBr36_00739 [Pyricularia pennisetigena]|uniref:hypothetical protein n=1 Tax=Pyricularia pennisetigena TaxID=1578925 RepID=UPI00115014BA|nr:hypothetical protein PpBr36_00739 [Pyricularia pennisetigena]TLS28987.1 hypothetical protein PpBr36_00739 [Pyricularia pennisetigena]